MKEVNCIICEQLFESDANTSLEQPTCSEECLDDLTDWMLRDANRQRQQDYHAVQIEQLKYEAEAEIKRLEDENKRRSSAR